MTAWTSVPLFRDDSSEQPWIVWQKKTSLTGLSTSETVETNMSETTTDTSPVHMHIPEPVISRKQYQSVLNRISAAQRKAGAFCSV